MRRVHVIAASNRPGALGRPVADWVAEHAGARGDMEVTVVDLAEVNLPFLDEPEHPSTGRYIHQHTKDWSATIQAADGLVLVLPMYNGTFGAVLKNAIDVLHGEWIGKPVALVSYSGGATGGAPAVDMLKPILVRLSMRPTDSSLSIPAVSQRVGEDRVFRSTGTQDADVDGVLDELAGIMAAVDAEPAEAAG